MKKIPVTDIQDGMILAQPVVGSAGNVLIGIGAVLRANMSTRLTGWGITTLFVESSEEEAPVTGNTPPSHNYKESVDACFQGRLVNSAMRTIHRCVLQHRGYPNG